MTGMLGAALSPVLRPEDRSGWPAAIGAALSDPDQPRLEFQSIIDLRRGVVAGYEALARFSGPPSGSREN